MDPQFQPIGRTGRTSTSTSTTNILSSLPSEILLCVFDYLKVDQLLPIDLATLRAITRIALMDTLGGQWWNINPRCDSRTVALSNHHYIRNIVIIEQENLETGMRMSEDRAFKGSSRYHTTITRQVFIVTIVTSPPTSGASLSSVSTNGRAITLLTDGFLSSLISWLQYPAAIIISTRIVTTLAVLIPQQSYRNTGNIAHGNIALFLFLHHENSSSDWQERQSVHFQCTGIDRHKDQLIFSLVHPETGDRIKFSTDSWSQSLLSSTRGSLGGSTDSHGKGYHKISATGLSLFVRLGSHEEPVRAFWMVESGSGGKHYSVIEIKPGDWPDDHKPMVFLPWSASPGGQGSVANFQQRLVQPQEQLQQDREESLSNRNSSDSMRHLPRHDGNDHGAQGHDDTDCDGRGERTRIRKRHMYVSSNKDPIIIDTFACILISS
ncbi:MAG: hypothetical protein J3Q66DRAFT_383664 [Benniella sp.]|nr:MAG: hypothetical protein J3Q66DRAFT_383664 [Benniella sp.]